MLSLHILHLKKLALPRWLSWLSVCLSSFGLGHGLRVMESGPKLGSVLRKEPARDSLSPSMPVPISHSFSLTYINQSSLKKKKITRQYYEQFYVNRFNNVDGMERCLEKYTLVVPVWPSGLILCLWLWSWFPGPGIEPRLGSLLPPPLPACRLVISLSLSVSNK